MKPQKYTLMIVDEDGNVIDSVDHYATPEEIEDILIYPGRLEDFLECVGCSTMWHGSHLTEHVSEGDIFFYCPSCEVPRFVGQAKNYQKRKGTMLKPECIEPRDYPFCVQAANPKDPQGWWRDAMTIRQRAHIQEWLIKIDHPLINERSKIRTLEECFVQLVKDYRSALISN